MNELALFAGAGGGLLASRLLGWTTIGAVEIEEYPRKVLLQRQKDGCLEKFPIWEDVRTFNGRSWRGLVDVITGGFPCQNISSAGKGEGIAGKHSSLWFEFERIISEVRPQFIFAENSPFLRTRGLNQVLRGLNRLGYDARWCVLGARHVRANQRRDRIWILAYTNQVRWEGSPSQTGTDPKVKLRCCAKNDFYPHTEKIRLVEHAYLSRKPDDLANWVDRFEAIGNGQVPLVAATAWNILSDGLL